MHISENFVMREIAGECVIVPIGEEASRFHGLITVNDSGAFLWSILQKSDTTLDQLKKAFTAEYGIDLETAESDIKSFLNILRVRNILHDA